MLYVFIICMIILQIAKTSSDLLCREASALGCEAVKQYVYFVGAYAYLSATLSGFS